MINKAEKVEIIVFRWNTLQMQGQIIYLTHTKKKNSYRSHRVSQWNN